MTTHPEDNNIDQQRLDLERDRLRFERQGVAFRYAAVLGALATFLWGAFQYFHGIDLERAKRRQDQEIANSVDKMAASQPFLTLQLKLLQEATQTAAFLAVSPESPERVKKRERFEQLYWGELALVERGPVESAMVAFRLALEGNASPDELRRLSLDLAHACRAELAKSWNVSHWLRHE